MASWLRRRSWPRAPRVDPDDLLRSVPGADNLGGSEKCQRRCWSPSARTSLVAVAKSVAAVVTGSVSIVAEAAHSWADAGNEVFLLIANRRSAPPARPCAPVRLWPGGVCLVAVRRASGCSWPALRCQSRAAFRSSSDPEPASDFVVGYVVLAVSFVLEGVSFLQSVRQAKPEAESLQRDLIEHVLASSDPTLRAVFAEDFAALTGLLIATAGLAAHQLTGSSIPDAIGSILVGLLLAVVAIVLINTQSAVPGRPGVDPRVRAAALQALLDAPEVARVTYLRLEFVGPRMVSVVGDVDLTGDDTESHLAVRLRALEARITRFARGGRRPAEVSAPDEPTLIV